MVPVTRQMRPTRRPAALAKPSDIWPHGERELLARRGRSVLHVRPRRRRNTSESHAPRRRRTRAAAGKLDSRRARGSLGLCSGCPSGCKSASTPTFICSRATLLFAGWKALSRFWRVEGAWRARPACGLPWLPAILKRGAVSPLFPLFSPFYRDLARNTPLVNQIT